MSEQQIVPGWYPDPSVPDQVRYHDGRQWTSHSAQRTPDLSRPTLGGGWFTLGWVLIGALVVMILTEAFAALHALDLNSTLNDWIDDPQTYNGASDRALQQRDTLMTILLLVMTLVLLVLFIVWTYQAHRSSAVERQFLRHDSGWAIGSWFVPFLNLVRPPQMVQDVHRGAAQGRSTPLVGAWWIALLVSRVLGVVANAQLPDDIGGGSQEFLDRLGTATTTSVAADAFSVAAALFAILLVRRVSGRVREAVDAQAAPARPW